MLEMTVFKCLDNDKITNLVDDFVQKRNQLKTDGDALAVELGGTSSKITGNDHYGYQMQGILSDEVPEGKWRSEGWSSDGEGGSSMLWVPDARSNAGKALRKRIASMKIGSIGECGLPDIFFPDELMTSTAGMDKINGQWYGIYGRRNLTEEQAKKVDSKLWERINVSEYALASESKQDD